MARPNAPRRGPALITARSPPPPCRPRARPHHGPQPPPSHARPGPSSLRPAARPRPCPITARRPRPAMPARGRPHHGPQPPGQRQTEPTPTYERRPRQHRHPGSPTASPSVSRADYAGFGSASFSVDGTVAAQTAASTDRQHQWRAGGRAARLPVICGMPGSSRTDSTRAERFPAVSRFRSGGRAGHQRPYTVWLSENISGGMAGRPKLRRSRPARRGTDDQDRRDGGRALGAGRTGIRDRRDGRSGPAGRTIGAGGDGRGAIGTGVRAEVSRGAR